MLVLIIITMLFTILYVTFTFVIPLKQTYKLLKQQYVDGNLPIFHLWSMYWLIYAFFLLVKHILTFLAIKQFQVVSLLFFIWLYHEDFKGALYLKQLLVKALEGNEKVIILLQSLKQWNETFQILQQDKSQKEN